MTKEIGAPLSAFFQQFDDLLTVEIIDVGAREELGDLFIRRHVLDGCVDFLAYRRRTVLPFVVAVTTIDQPIEELVVVDVDGEVFLANHCVP